ncbi:MAG: GNAT family N-acetyltransferase [Neisseria sp.]|uniref:GNAT family N-acetyltransferase n=1 Tax=Neisseria sp. TaxID=192066 RepID=UPI0026DC5697|nr:GNAT family N-acetyltransferase [Neisseria sp.]MDO4641170.1 GNAT family N-acetyltransferase [Neisseria sp.]
MSLFTVLRPALPDDCEAIHNTHRFSVQYTCEHSYDRRVLEAWSALLHPDSYREVLNNTNKALWVIEYQRRIRGFFQIDFVQSQLDALYVHPFLHNRGLGTALLNRAEALAAHSGLGFLKLYASVNSVGFYRINGYRSLGSAILPLNLEVSVECELMRKYLDDY